MSCIQSYVKGFINDCSVSIHTSHFSTKDQQSRNVKRKPHFKIVKLTKYHAICNSFLIQLNSASNYTNTPNGKNN